MILKPRHISSLPFHIKNFCILIPVAFQYLPIVKHMEIIVIAVHMASYLRIKRKRLHGPLIRRHPGLIVKLAVPITGVAKDLADSRLRPHSSNLFTSLPDRLPQKASAFRRPFSRGMLTVNSLDFSIRLYVCLEYPHRYHEYRFVPDVAYGTFILSSSCRVIPALYCQECSLF